MTLLTVDAKLMPVLPVIARPASTHALVVSFGMGSAFRASLIVGLKAEAVELVPSVPDMFGWYYPDAKAVLADPNGKVIVTDGRNHLEVTNERYDIIVTDPPPPIESSGAAVISSAEYYRAGRAHLTDGGIMLQWVPYGGPAEDLNDHIRTFASVFPHVTIVKGAGGWGMYMLGSSAPITFPEADVRAVLSRPGVLADLSSAFDAPAKTVDDWSRSSRGRPAHRGGRQRTPARVRSSRTTGRGPSISCCGDCSATRGAERGRSSAGPVRGSSAAGRPASDPASAGPSRRRGRPGPRMARRHRCTRSAAPSPAWEARGSGSPTPRRR